MEIESIIINSINEEMYEIEKGLWWDILKSRLKKFSIEYSKKNTESEKNERNEDQKIV